jgi:hypothetical protein
MSKYLKNLVINNKVDFIAIQETKLVIISEPTCYKYK